MGRLLLLANTRQENFEKNKSIAFWYTKKKVMYILNVLNNKLPTLYNSGGLLNCMYNDNNNVENRSKIKESLIPTDIIFFIL